MVTQNMLRIKKKKSDLWLLSIYSNAPQIQYQRLLLMYAPIIDINNGMKF